MDTTTGEAWKEAGVYTAGLAMRDHDDDGIATDTRTAGHSGMSGGTDGAPTTFP